MNQININQRYIIKMYNNLIITAKVINIGDTFIMITDYIDSKYETRLHTTTILINQIKQINQINHFNINSIPKNLSSNILIPIAYNKKKDSLKINTHYHIYYKNLIKDKSKYFYGYLNDHDTTNIYFSNCYDINKRFLGKMTIELNKIHNIIDLHDIMKLYRKYIPYDVLFYINMFI